MDNFNKKSDAKVQIYISQEDSLQREKEQKPTYPLGNYIH